MIHFRIGSIIYIYGFNQTKPISGFAYKPYTMMLSSLPIYSFIQHLLFSHYQTTHPIQEQQPTSTMPSLIETPGIVHLLRPSTDTHHSRKSKLGGGNNIFRMFKLLPMLSTGCKMVALLGRPNKSMLSDRATTVTLFGPRKGRICLAIQEDPRSTPYFLIELPILTTTLHKEMASGLVKIALESETKTHKKKLVEEYVWAVYCNGRKSGFAIRRKSSSEDEREVMKVLRGVSMGAGVLPEREEEKEGEQITYMRARFERVVGSKDSEALYMISPDGGGAGNGGGDGGGGGPEISIFLVRVK